MSTTYDRSAQTAPATLTDVWAPRVLSILRIVVALLFIEHGTQKLFGFPAPPGFPTPAPFTLLWFAAVLEALGGVLVLIGLFTRPVAFLLSGEMAVAYWMAHAPRGPIPLPAGEGVIAQPRRPRSARCAAAAARARPVRASARYRLSATARSPA